MGYVYKITNLVNGKVYVGQTITAIARRWQAHVSQANSKHSSYPISRAIRKYGATSFKIEQLCESNSLDELECYFISLYGSCDSLFGYNIESGGNRNKIISLETRKKISEAQIGRQPWNKGKKLGKPKESAVTASALAHHKAVIRISPIDGASKTYPSLKSTKADGFNPSQVSLCCKHPDKHKSHKNYNWKYVASSFESEKGI